MSRRAKRPQGGIRCRDEHGDQIRSGLLLVLAERQNWRCCYCGCRMTVVTHRPDMPLAPGMDAKYGFGLWNSIPLSVGVEALLWALGIYVYVRSTRATGRWGSWGLGAFVGVMTLSWLSGVFGPTPPGIQVVAISALVFVPITLAWAWAIDRARSALA